MTEVEGDEDAFNEIERQAEQRKAAVKAAVFPKDIGVERMYEIGWNSALEMASFSIEHDFTKAFGKDTLHSIAVYIRGLKK